MMDQSIGNLQLMMEADLKDFYGKKKNYAFGMQFVAFLCDDLRIPLVCTLCSKVGSLSNMLRHLSSIGHQVNVLEKTFPSILKQARDLYAPKDTNFILLIADIAHEIESHLGHQQPFATSSESYAENPNLINESLNCEPAPSELIEKLKEIVRKAHARKESKSNNRNQPKRYSRGDQNEPRKDSRRKSSKKDSRRSSKKDTRHESRGRDRSHRTPSKAEGESNYKKRKHTHGKETSRSSKKMKAETSSAKCQQAQSSTEAQPTQPSSKMHTKIDVYLRQHSDELNKLILNYCHYSEFYQLHPRYQEEWNSFGINEYYKVQSVDECDFTAQWNVHWPKRLHEMKKEDMLELRVNLRKQFDFPINQSDRDELEQIVMERKVKITKKQPVVPIFCNFADNHHVVIAPAPIVPLIDLSEIGSSMRQHVNDVNDNNNDVISNPFSAISNADLTVMIESFSSLSEGVQNNLLAVIENLEANEMKRFNKRLGGNLPDGNPEEVPAGEVPATAASKLPGTEDDSLDSLSNLEKVVPTKKERTVNELSADEGDEAKNGTEPTFDIFFN